MHVYKIYMEIKTDFYRKACSSSHRRDFISSHFRTVLLFPNQSRRRISRKEEEKKQHCVYIGVLLKYAAFIAN